MEEYQFDLHYKQGEWPKSTLSLKTFFSGAELSKFRRSGTLGAPWRSRAEVQALRAEGVKKSKSPSRSGHGRHLGVGSNSGSGSLHHSNSSRGVSPLGSGREWTPGASGTLGELERSRSGDERGTPMWGSTWECGPMSGM